MRLGMIALLVVGLAGSTTRAEREPEPREKADAVVLGNVKKITTKESKFGNDGVRTDYTAEVEVTKAEKGEGIKVGDTIKVHWYDVTKRPSKLLPAAYGHEYKVKKGDAAKFWLMGSVKKGLTVIYNKDGVETVKK